MIQFPSSLPSRRRLLACIAGLFIARLLWKIGKFIHHIFTSVDQSRIVHHNCIPPDDYKHQGVTQQSSLELVRAKYPELVGLVESGNLLVVEPAKMLKQALAKHYNNQTGEQAPPGFTEEDVQELMVSNPLQACMSAPVPKLMFIVGTVHVSKQSGEDVKKVIKTLQPAAVVLELCQQRLHALLVDPYQNPLTDLEPSKERLAQQGAKPKNVPEILRAALSSRDHNVLTTVMSGMYSKLEDKLEVRAGIEFIAARQALIEMLREQQQSTQDRSQSQPQQQTSPSTSAGADEAVELLSAAESSNSNSPTVQQQQQQEEEELQEQQLTWLQKVVPGDRAVVDTLLGLWGSLRPVRRLHFIWTLLTGLLEDIDEDIIKALANEDMVELLLKEFRETYPEVMKPLLHDRNWVLATNTWHVAQQTAPEEGPVVAIVGKGHMGGMVYVCEWLVQMFVKTGGMPVQLVMQHREGQHH